LDLDVGRLTIFDSSLKPRKVIALEGCSVSVINPSSFLITNLESSYKFECVNDETAEWVNNISFYIIKANSQLGTSLEKSGWLLKDGKSRWFAIRDGRLHWFTKEQNANFDDNGKSSAALQNIKLNMMNNQKDTKFRFELIDTSNNKKYLIKATNESDLSSWMLALTSATETVRKSSLAPKVPTFGTPLSALLRAEKDLGRINENAVLPYVPKKALDFLSTPNAMNTPGLFQLLGNFTKVREWIGQLNKGGELDLKDASSHDVTLLLKQFLRQLPEPLIISRLRDSILDARGDSPKLRKLVEGKVFLKEIWGKN
jgi:hypothetical protein